jgi:hypothetical protein
MPAYNRTWTIYLCQNQTSVVKCRWVRHLPKPAQWPEMHPQYLLVGPPLQVLEFDIFSK